LHCIALHCMNVSKGAKRVHQHTPLLQQNPRDMRTAHSCLALVRAGRRPCVCTCVGA
jgi:hypothetical protein